MAVFASLIPAQTFLDANRADLVRMVPDLSTVAFDLNQSKLTPLISEMGRQIASMGANSRMFLWQEIYTRRVSIGLILGGQTIATHFVT